MISERENRLVLVEKCKYLMSKLPFGEFDIEDLDITIMVIEKESERINRPLKEILINMEPLDNHVLQSLFTTPELVNLGKTLSQYIQYNSYI
ncbi:MAG TPA: hypothetical protein VJR94_11325 [Candidatus Nitrosocosmicus sp.]|nr:hypothetical protein [Candidatus Nitrosocosmicus sp.]